MERFYEWMARAYFATATTALMLMAWLLLAGGFWEVAEATVARDVLKVVDSVGLLIIGFAVIETAKFIAEEELLRRRELRSAVESRRSLTKFVTIIVIAASLEALVMVFKASRTTVADAVYPALLFVAAMFALVSLGLYQWLSSRIGIESEQGEQR
jgi:hypothetical protein